MPRLIDKLDAAAGRTPEFLDTGVDYLKRRPGPARIIEDEAYVGGWFERFDGEFNWKDSSAFDMAFQCWYHLTLDTPSHFIVANLADLTRGSNAALLVVDKKTGEYEHSSFTAVLPQRRTVMDPNGREFRDPETNTFIRVSRRLRKVHFAIHLGHLHLIGTCKTALGPPLVQATRFHRGRGSLQWYGCLEVDHAQLIINERIHKIPSGSMGTYDRTMGHQRGIQSWNWIAACGWARDEATGEHTQVGVQVARDRLEARPRVESKKYAVWVDGELHKLPSAAFDYQHHGGPDDLPGPWRIYSPEPDARGEIELRFVPKYHRYEGKRMYLVHADFHQYYGEVKGRIRIGNRTLLLEPCFAVTEQSLLEL